MSVLRYARFAALGFARTVQYEATWPSTGDMGGAGLLVGREEPHAGAARLRLQPRHGDIAACRGTGRHTTEPD